MGSLPGGEQTFQIINEIDNKLNEDEKDLVEIQKAMNELKAETEKLDESVVEVSNKATTEC